ncbi:MAG: phosphoserine transaminase [Varibaculum sp.]|nr:phosphoserine transaminase [Varibaculum sp.]
MIQIPSDMLPADGRFGSGPSPIGHGHVRALDSFGVMGTSHRKPPVKNLVSQIQEQVCELFSVPEGHRVVLGNGGATLFWSAACASLIRHRSAHAVLGAFSEKFSKEAAGAPFLADPAIFHADFGQYRPVAPVADADAYCWPHNETSTGVATAVERPEGISDDALVLIDATSIAGAIEVNLNGIDAYYFSPQKALASDGGLWLAVMSPAALARATEIESQAGVSGRWIPSILNVATAARNSEKHQTLNTPAIATLLLLSQQLGWILDNGGLQFSAHRCRQSSDTLYSWAEKSDYAHPFVADTSLRSPVVATITLDDHIDATELQKHLTANGIVDISGYRAVGGNQIRVGVFPTVDPGDVEALTACIDYVAQRL